MTSPLSFPATNGGSLPFYGIGLRVYDLLAGRYGFGKSSHVSRAEIVREIPSINTEGLRGGTRYYDGQFDDARLAINLATTATDQGATLVNYAPVVRLLKSSAGTIEGVVLRDAESGDELTALGKVVVNATGPFADGVRKLDRGDLPPVIAPSQGVHIVIDRSFIPGDSAIMVPSTDDGRVMFAIPWHDVAVVGTTDTPINRIDLEPVPLREEVDFILETANRYLDRPATRDDIHSVFAGIRPLVKIGNSANTAALSRDHTILIDPDSGLMTVAGGKWTTYRRMAEDVIDQAIVLGALDARECVTKHFSIHGFHRYAERFGELAFYGSDAQLVEKLGEQNPRMREKLHPKLPITGAEVQWACRNEMARTVDDVLSRRTRCLLFDARVGDRGRAAGRRDHGGRARPRSGMGGAAECRFHEARRGVSGPGDVVTRRIPRTITHSRSSTFFSHRLHRLHRFFAGIVWRHAEDPGSPA